MVFINATQRTHDKYAQLVGNKLIKKNIWYLFHSLHASFGSGIGGGCCLCGFLGGEFGRSKKTRKKNIFPRGQRQVTETVPVHMMAATRGSLTCGALTPDLASLCSCISLVLQKNFFFSRKILVAKPAMNIIPAAQEWEWDLVELSRLWTGVFFIHFSFRTDIKMNKLYET